MRAMKRESACELGVARKAGSYRITSRNVGRL